MNQLNDLTVTQVKTQKSHIFTGAELEELCAKNTLINNTNLDEYEPHHFGYESYLSLLKAIIYDGLVPYLTDEACEEYECEPEQVMLNISLFDGLEEEIGLSNALSNAFEDNISLLRNLFL